MKGVSPLMATILILPIILAIGIFFLTWSFKIFTATEEKASESQRLMENVGAQLVIDNIYKENVYIRNTGTDEFNGTVVLYLNGNPTCSRSDSGPFQFEVSLDLKPNEVKKVEIGCCISKGTNEITITAKNQRVFGTIVNFDVSQQTFRDWERTAGNDSAECLVLNYASCSSGDYHDCVINQVTELENYIMDLANSETWYAEEPPYTWQIENVTGDGLCCTCGHCFVMLARAKFFYNSGVLKGKHIWLSGDANETPCKIGNINGIYINDNMYVFLNGHLLVYNGTSYGGIHLTGPLPDGSSRPESKDWCIKPVDLTGTPFSENCKWNDVLIAFEDYCQVTDEAGGVYGMYLTVQ